MASSIGPSPVWASDLSASGLYYDGILDQNQLEKVFELHKRELDLVLECPVRPKQ